MNDSEFIARTILELLGKGTPLVLISIVSQAGSSPRHSGSKMVVDTSGKSYGTIGGSLLEATAIREAQSAAKSRRSKLLEFSLAGKDAQAQGMICGGTTRLLLDYIAATPENRGFFQDWRSAVVAGKDFFFLTHFKETAQGIEICGHSLYFSDGRFTGNCNLSEPDQLVIKEEAHWISQTAIVEVNDTKAVLDPIRRLITVYCFGAGHVAVPTAHIAALCGFRVVVFDDRADFANRERFPEADSIRVIQDFNRALEGLEIDADSFIVILTRGHKFDREVLEQSLKTRAGYIGMISSRRKREVIYKTLMDTGVTQAALDKVHSPIGISIGGETPEEIAVSIVAELIKVRADMQP
jgi:xanthine dehydrogenase accessory factor